MSLINKEMIN